MNKQNKIISVFIISLTIVLTLTLTIKAINDIDRYSSNIPLQTPLDENWIVGETILSETIFSKEIIETETLTFASNFPLHRLFVKNPENSLSSNLAYFELCVVSDTVQTTDYWVTFNYEIYAGSEGTLTYDFIGMFKDLATLNGFSHVNTASGTYEITNDFIDNFGNIHIIIEVVILGVSNEMYLDVFILNYVNETRTQIIDENDSYSIGNIYGFGVAIDECYFERNILYQNIPSYYQEISDYITIHVIDFQISEYATKIYLYTPTHFDFSSINPNATVIYQNSRYEITNLFEGNYRIQFSSNSSYYLSLQEISDSLLNDSGFEKFSLIDYEGTFSNVSLSSERHSEGYFSCEIGSSTNQTISFQYNINYTGLLFSSFDLYISNTSTFESIEFGYNNQSIIYNTTLTTSLLKWERYFFDFNLNGYNSSGNIFINLNNFSGVCNIDDFRFFNSSIDFSTIGDNYYNIYSQIINLNSYSSKPISNRFVNILITNSTTIILNESIQLNIVGILNYNFSYNLNEEYEYIISIECIDSTYYDSESVLHDIYPDWNYYKTITITNPTSFLLENILVFLEFDFETSNQNDFEDLLFTDSSDTILDFHIFDYIDSTTAYVYIEIPSIEASLTEEIKVYFGNDLSTDYSDTNGVYQDNDIELVTHFGDSGNTAEDDSTNDYDFSTDGSVDLDGDSCIGKSASGFDSTTSKFLTRSSTSPNIEGDGNYTILIWVKDDGTGTSNGFFGTDNLAQDFAIYHTVGTGRIYYRSGTEYDYTSGFTPTTDVWFSLSITYDTVANNVSYYKDGIHIADDSHSGYFHTGYSNYYIGSWDTYIMDGSLDEFFFIREKWNDAKIEAFYKYQNDYESYISYSESFSTNFITYYNYLVNQTFYPNNFTETAIYRDCYFNFYSINDGLGLSENLLKIYIKDLSRTSFTRVYSFTQIKCYEIFEVQLKNYYDVIIYTNNSVIFSTFIDIGLDFHKVYIWNNATNENESIAVTIEIENNNITFDYGLLAKYQMLELRLLGDNYSIVVKPEYYVNEELTYRYYDTEFEIEVNESSTQFEVGVFCEQILQSDSSETIYTFQDITSKIMLFASVLFANITIRRNAHKSIKKYWYVALLFVFILSLTIYLLTDKILLGIGIFLFIVLSYILVSLLIRQKVIKQNAI